MRLRVIALVLGAALALPLLAWTGIHFYWRVRIVRAIRTLQEQPKIDSGDHELLLHDAGCRALPYLIDSLSESKDPDYLGRATYQTTLDVTAPGWGHGLLPPETQERMKVWIVGRDDSPAEVEQKIEAIRRYWNENAHKHHQWWRVWSAACAVREEES